MKKAEIKQGIYKVITVAVKFHGHAFGKSLARSLVHAMSELIKIGTVHRRPNTDNAESYVF
jgi:hypothetical protein